MSLVYEALQKAEREKNRSAGVPAVPAKPLPLPEPPKTAATASATPARRLPWGAILGIAGMVAVVLAAVIVLTRVTPVGGTRSAASAPEPPATQPAPAEPPAVAATTENDSRFKLTGIMGTPDGKFGAIINGRAVYEGHYIEGAIVKKIERDRVTLDWNGRPILLRLF